MLAWTAYAGRSASSTEENELGGHSRAEAVATFIEGRYQKDLLRLSLSLAAVAIGIGLILGLAVWALASLRGESSRSRFVAARSLIAVALLHGWMFAWSMAKSPQLYASAFYARGGLYRSAQVLVTDVLGRFGVVTLGVVAIVVYVRPSRVRALALRSYASGERALVALSARPKAGIAPVAFFVLALVAPPFAVRPAALAAPGGAADILAKGSGSAAAPLNVLILAADSLRADRVNARTMPALASRAKDRGITFDRAYVSLPRTFSSWVTLLTGVYPFHHGVRSMFPRWEDRAHALHAIPTELAARGYATSVVSDYAGDIFGRVELGFSRVETPSFDFRVLVAQRALERELPLLPVLHSHAGRAVFPVMKELADAADPDLLADDVERELERLRRGPFFLTAFFSAAHFPYAAPAPYYRRFTDPSYRGRFKYHKPVGLGREGPADEADVAQVRALYDGSVASIDAALGRVFRKLDKLGLTESTLVVVTADHGEMLYENGHGQGHGDHLFGDEVTHVPLIVFDPSSPKGRPSVSAIVRDVDLAPTIYERLGVEPPSGRDGASFAALLRGESIASRLAFAETELWFTEEIQGLAPELRVPYPGILHLTEVDAEHHDEVVLRRSAEAITTFARHRMVRDERYKLVYVPTRRGPRYFLFDTKEDPGEQKDVATEHPEIVRTLRAELFAWMLGDPRTEVRDGMVVPRSVLAEGAAR